jgi:hypothetical protein
MSRRSATDRGTALLLYPAGVLVLMVLAAIAVDFSVIRLARQELLSTAQAAADDSVGMVDEASLRAGDRLAVDFDRATRLVDEEFAAADLTCAGGVSTTVVAGPRPGTVIVTATCEVAHIFGRAIPGTPRTERITAEAVGERVQL